MHFWWEGFVVKLRIQQEFAQSKVIFLKKWKWKSDYVCTYNMVHKKRANLRISFIFMGSVTIYFTSLAFNSGWTNWWLIVSWCTWWFILFFFCPNVVITFFMNDIVLVMVTQENPTKKLWLVLRKIVCGLSPLIK